MSCFIIEAIRALFTEQGSFVLILAWIYYSSQILLFGAEFTQVYARRYGSLVQGHVVEEAT